MLNTTKNPHPDAGPDLLMPDVTHDPAVLDIESFPIQKPFGRQWQAEHNDSWEVDMHTRLVKTLLITAVLAVLGLTAAGAQSESGIRGNVVSEGPQFEIFISSFASDIPTSNVLNSRFETEAGVRGTYNFNGRFAVEGSLSKSGNYDAWLGDLSAKYYLKNRGRVVAYALGGPGLIWGSDVPGDEMTVHLGLGLEIAAGRHLYVRPEVRGVALAKDLGTTDALFSLGLGWRM